MLKQKLNINTTRLTKLFKKEDESLFPSHLGIGIVMVLGVLAALAQFPKESEEIVNKEPLVSMDTLIPADDSLIPIKVANYESLDQIIGNFGVVDLFSTPLDPTQKPSRVAFAVKLVRSPNSSSHFSVLVPAEKAAKIAGFQGEFTVVVRNPKIVGTKFVNKQARRPQRRVIYHWEE